MIPKLASCVRALDSGVSAAHIINGTVPHALLLEMLTVLDVVVVAHVDELGRLIAHGLHDGGVAVAEAADTDAGEEIEVKLWSVCSRLRATASAPS